MAEPKNRVLDRRAYIIGSATNLSADVQGIGSDAKSVGINSLCVQNFMYGFSGTAWDRIRTHFDPGTVTFTSTGVKGTNDLVTGMSKHTWHILTDASASNITVKLQGSIDNSNWFDLDEYTGTANTMRHVVNKPVRYIRFNCTSMGDASYVSCRYFGMR